MSAQVAVTTVQHSSAVHGSAAQAMEEAVSLMLLPLDVQSNATGVSVARSVLAHVSCSGGGPVSPGSLAGFPVQLYISEKPPATPLPSLRNRTTKAPLIGASTMAAGAVKPDSLPASNGSGGSVLSSSHTKSNAASTLKLEKLTDTASVAHSTIHLQFEFDSYVAWFPLL